MSRFLRDESGATAIEYGLICALITLVIIAGYQAVAQGNADKYQFIADEIDKVL